MRYIKLYAAIVAAGLTLFACWLFFENWRTAAVKEQQAADQHAHKIAQAKQARAEYEAAVEAEWKPVIELLDDFGNGKISREQFLQRVASGRFSMAPVDNSPYSHIQNAASVIRGAINDDGTERAKGFAKVARQKRDKAKANP